MVRCATRRTIGLAIAGAIIAATVGGAGAGADALSTSTASARFLGGSLLLNSTALDSVPVLGGVSASNSGGATQTSTSSPDVSSLTGSTATIPGGSGLTFGQFAQLGAVNQYAAAADLGVSRAGAGAISNAGVVDLNGSGGFPADASLDVAGLLGPVASGVLSTARLRLDAITAVVAADAALAGAPATTCTNISAPVHCRDYTIAGARLDLNSPLVATLIGDLNTALGAASTTINGLTASLVTSVISGVNSVMSTLTGLVPGVGVVSNTLSASVTADLQAALASVLSQTLTDGIVSIDLGTGQVTADLAALSGSLNGLPPNTPVLGASMITALVSRITALLTGLQSQISTAVTSALGAVTATLSGGICLLQVAAVCTAGLDVAYNGTLAALASGSAALTVTGAGLLAPLLVGPALTTVVHAVQGALAAVASPALTTAVTGVAGAASTGVTTLLAALSPVLTAIPGVLAFTVNVQETGSSPGSYREVAMRVGVGSGSVATLDLARVQAGANTLGAIPTLTAITAGHGPLVGGNTVTVHGTDFIAGTVVLFHNTSRTPAWIDPSGTALTFSVPPGTVSGPVSVAVSNSDGTSNASSYTYDPPTLTATGPVHPGDRAPVSSDGWPADTNVTVRLRTAAGAAIGAPMTVRTTYGGAFPANTTILVPSGASAGAHSVLGTDAAGDHAQHALLVTVLVTGSTPPATTPAPSSLVPSDVPKTSAPGGPSSLPTTGLDARDPLLLAAVLLQLGVTAMYASTLQHRRRRH
ncbi:MAG TPA: choice-of-anchor G family protein [Jatrophihabitans sp.]|jgi:hypothetical protein|uniref:choice-of-anchor G family protein n=1 Tax=Jatrophihabitans sp. TaxID=1932789 RepID=UPI002DFBF722|nr:choice-of-anchor G family protein [Jatrophihabitans sp.]